MDVIDINIFETTETVDINVTPNLTTININRTTNVSPVTSVNGQVGDVIIPASTLDEVLTEGNTSLLDAKVGTLGLWDIGNSYYNKLFTQGDAFLYQLNNGQTPFKVDLSSIRFSNGINTLELYHNIITGNRNINFPDADGTLALTSDIPVGGLTSVGLTMPLAFSVANSPLTSDGTIDVTAIGTSSQYIRGDGQLATLPTGAGGGSTVSYYLNGSINSSVAGYKQLSNTATIGGGTDFTLVGNGLIAQFLTDLGNPNRIEIPGGAWNFEMYFQANSAGGNQKFYIELLKYDGSTFTSIASSISVPEEITGGTATDLYLTSLAVPTTPLLVTDRLAIRVYIVDNAVGRTITLHTEDNTLCEIITTFSGGVTSLNGLTANTQYLGVGTSGSDFNISSLSETHTFNLPTASATNRGALSSTDWSIFNGKQNALTNPITGTGTTNYIPKFTAGSTLSNSVIFETSNSILVGYTSLIGTEKLGISGYILSRATAQSGGMYFGSSAHGIRRIDGGNNIEMFTSGGSLFLTGNGAGNATKVTIDQNANVLVPNGSTVANAGFTQSFIGFGKTWGTISVSSGQTIYANQVGDTLFGNYAADGGFRFYTNVVGGASELMRLTSAGRLGIGTTAPVASAKVQIDSTTQGFLPPRMTNAQRTAIATPAVGLCVYCTDAVEGLYINKSTGWTYIV